MEKILTLGILLAIAGLLDASSLRTENVDTDLRDRAVVKSKLAQLRQLFLEGKTYRELQEQSQNLKLDHRHNEKPMNNARFRSITHLNRNLLDELYQGDIRLSVEQADYLLKQALLSHREKRQSLSDNAFPNSKWTDGVPYQIHPSFPESSKQIIRKAVQFWQDNTCITFTENGSGPHKILFKRDEEGCWSSIGRQDGATQPVNLGDDCEHFGVITHEIGHALGFWHEQSRYDRDTFVNLNLANATPLTNDNYGVAYDYGSNMHYEQDEFAIDVSVPVIIAKDPDMQHTMGNRFMPTFNDVKVMNARYQCTCPASTIVCTRGGYPDPKNCNKCKCPWGFAGTNCELRQPATNGSATCGATLSATSAWQTLSASVGSGSADFLPDTTACFWHITCRIFLERCDPGFKASLRTAPFLQSPSNTVIEIQRITCCDYHSWGCSWGGIETNMGSDFRSSGYRYCYNQDFAGHPTKTSAINLVMLAAWNRIGTTPFTIQYRSVPKP